MLNKNIKFQKIEKAFLHSKKIIHKTLSYSKKILFWVAGLIFRKVQQIRNDSIDVFYAFQYSETHEKFYKVGFLVIIFYIIFTLLFSPPLLETNETVASVNNKESYYSIFQTIFLWSIAITFSIGYSKEFLQKLSNLMKRKIAFNIVLSAILFTIYILSDFLTNHFIYDFTNIDASNFGFGKIVLKLIFVPYAWIIFALIFVAVNTIHLTIKTTIKFFPFYFLTIIQVILWFEWKWLENKLYKIETEGEKSATKIIIALITAIFFINFWSHVTFNNSLINNFSKQLFISSEYFPNSYCKNLKERNTLVSDIGGGIFSVYNTQSKEFEISQCELNYSK